MKTLVLLVCFTLFNSWCYAQSLFDCDQPSIDTLIVSTINDTVRISNEKLCSHCNAAFAISITQSSDSIYILESDTANGIAMCNCVFDIEISIAGLIPGNYIAVVHRYYGSIINQTEYVGTVQIVVPTSTPGNLSVISSQSDCITVGLNEYGKDLPEDYALSQNFPNPFNPVTTINYEIYKEGNVSIKLFDCLGNEIETLVNRFSTTGSYSLQYDASRLTSGVYFYQLIVNDFMSTKKMCVMK